MTELESGGGDCRGESGRFRRLGNCSDSAAGHSSFLLILLFVVISAHQAAKPLNLDCMDFPAVAEATARTGKPIYYRGEETPTHSGLYHPPLYIYLLALWFKVFGYGAAPARMFGAVCLLVQGAVGLATVRELCGSRFTHRLSPFYWLFLLLNPFALQVAAIPDIDSSIYGPLIGVVILAAVRLSWRQGEWRHDRARLREYGMVLVFIAMVLWAKMTTAALIPFLLMALLWRKHGGWRALGISFALGGGAFALFFLTYSLYGKWLDLDVGYSFRFLVHSLLRGSSLSMPLSERLVVTGSRFIANAKYLSIWTRLDVWLLAGFGALACLRVFSGNRSPRAAHAVAILIFALATAVGYAFVVGTFACAPFKYLMPVWSWLCLPLAAAGGHVLAGTWNAVLRPDAIRDSAARDHDHDRRALAWAGHGIVLALGVAWGVLVLQDRLIRGYPFATIVYPDGQLLAPLLVGLGVALVVALLRRKVGGSGWPLVLALWFGAGLNLGTAIVQSEAPYSTTYDYGQTGIAETAAFLRSVTDEDAVIVSMKDVGSLCGRRYLENYEAIHSGKEVTEEFLALVEAISVEVLVFTDGIGEDQLVRNPLLRQWVEANATVTARIGNYVVYRMNPRSP